jgi:hypothetical protein
MSKSASEPATASGNALDAAGPIANVHSRSATSGTSAIGATGARSATAMTPAPALANTARCADHVG